MLKGIPFTYQKADLLDNITVSRALIRELHTCLNKFPALADQCYTLMESEQTHAQEILKEILTMERDWDEVKLSGGEATKS